MRKNGTRQRFIDCTVERVVQAFLASLSQVFTYTIKDDDRVVERVTDNREECRDDRERDFEVHDLEERERRQEIVCCCDDCSQAESPLEPDCEIDERDRERDEHGDEGAARKLASNFWSHCFSANDPHVLRAELGVEDRLDLSGDAGSAGRLLSDGLLVLRANGVFPVGAVLLNFGALNTALVQRIPDICYVRRILKLHLHERSAGELDALVDRLDEERTNSAHDENRSKNGCDLPPADEVVVGVVK